ncbi:MAG TPA: class I SAM-dependent methyltransferase [Ktedonosporobacter sp.]|nr:class I SAM-dependent methyltransferase [Ktedonosporobacter sp.]
MSNPTDPRRELANAYFVQDRSNQDELTRLRIQDQMMTADMGGVLPEQPDTAHFQRVLDVGCGTGNWLLEVAKTYPGISLLIGVDANKKMVDYARGQAEAQGVSDRVEFHVMDALRMLEFPANFFSLVNQRMGQGYLRTWEWPKLLSEYRRVTRWNGVIRITESDITQSTSPAQMRLAELGLDVFYRAGHFFTRDFNGVTGQLADLLYRHGIQNIQTRVYTLEYHPGASQWQSFYEDARLLLRTVKPFFNKWTRLPEDYDALCQQALSEMQQPDFVATAKLVTFWGAPYK